MDTWCTLWTLSPPLSCCTEDMHLLPVASLLMSLWLVERSHCNSSFQDSMRELHSRFAISLYQTLTRTENSSNLILSPVSVSLSLALLQLGARGNTRAQLEGTLGYNVNGTSRPVCSRSDGEAGGELSSCAGGAQRRWYQVVWSGAAAGPAEHSGVWSHNTCL